MKAAPVRPRSQTSTSVPSPQPRVSTPQVGTYDDSSSATYKRSASTALAGTHQWTFPKLRALVLSMVRLGQTKLDGLGHMGTVDSDFMRHQFRLSILQWNPGAARRTPANIIAATCGRLHAVILQEASDHVRHITDQSESSLRTQAIRTSPSCS